MFSGLIKNEFIKLFSRKKTLIIFALYVFLLVIIAIIGENAEESYFTYNDPDFMIERLEEQISYEKEYLDSLKNEEAMNEEDIEEQIGYSKEHIESLEEEIEELKRQKEEGPIDWRVDYQRQIQENKFYIEELQNKDKISKETSDEINYLKQDIERLELLLDANSSPDDPYINTGINYLYNNLIAITAAFLTFGLIIFNSDNVSGEYNPGTFKFLIIQPVTRTKVLLSKFVVMALSSTALILVMQILMFLIVGLIKGFGNLNSPILIGLEFEKVINNGYESFSRVAGSGEFITMWNYILRMVVLEVVLIITVTAFVFMVSTVARSSVIANTICISILLGSSIVYGLSSRYREVSHLIFLHFNNVDEIVSGSIIGDTGIAIFTPVTVIVVSVITTIVCLLIALGVFKKRDLFI